MFSWNDLMKSAEKAKSAASDVSADKIADAINVNQMRDYVAEHVFGIRRRSTFSAIAESVGLVALGVVIGGGLMLYLADSGEVKETVKNAGEKVKKEAKNAKDEVSDYAQKRIDAARAPNGIGGDAKS